MKRTGKSVIQTKEAPEAIGPYSQAVCWNELVFCSGQIGLDPQSMTIVSEDVSDQTKQVLGNLERVLESSGSGMDQVLQCSIFLVDMEDFTTVNEVYGRFFETDPPARETVAVRSLPKEARVKISCIAFRKSGQ